MSEMRTQWFPEAAQAAECAASKIREHRQVTCAPRPDPAHKGLGKAPYGWMVGWSESAEKEAS